MNKQLELKKVNTQIRETKELIIEKFRVYELKLAGLEVRKKQLEKEVLNNTVSVETTITTIVDNEEMNCTNDESTKDNSIDQTTNLSSFNPSTSTSTANNSTMKVQSQGDLTTTNPKSTNNKTVANKEHICEQCGFKAAGPWALKYHMELHDVKQLPFSCAQCSKKFALNNDLNYHVLSVHSGLMNSNNAEYLCKDCGYQSFSLNNYTYHMRVKHVLNRI